MVRKGHWKKSSEKSGSGARDVKQAEEIRNVYEPLTWLDQFMALRTTKSNLDNEEFAKLTCLRAFRVLVPSRLTRLNYASYVPYLLTRLMTHVPLNVTKSLIKDNFKMF